MYSYALNNPLTNTDPTGLDCVYFNDAGDAAESIDQNSNSGECGSNGGDWVNGSTSASQIQYNANNDTFNIQSSSAFHNYNTTASAPGSQNSGIPCFGNCDTANGYNSSYKSVGQLYDTLDNAINSRLDPTGNRINNAYNAWANRHGAALNIYSCFANPGDVMAIKDLQQNHRADPSDPADPLLGGGATAIYMRNNGTSRNGGQSNILGNQESAAGVMNGAALLGNQIIAGGVCTTQ
jgi:hypothetical protein